MTRMYVQLCCINIVGTFDPLVCSVIWLLRKLSKLWWFIANQDDLWDWATHLLLTFSNAIETELCDVTFSFSWNLEIFLMVKTIELWWEATSLQLFKLSECNQTISSSITWSNSLMFRWILHEQHTNRHARPWLLPSTKKIAQPLHYDVSIIKGANGRRARPDTI